MTPKQFDALRETPDKADIDSLPPERRFQVLMSKVSLGDARFELAWQALEPCESQLGYALKCQWWAFKNNVTEVEKCLGKRIPGSDLEALVHFDNWLAWWYAQQGDKENAIRLYGIALHNAEVNLGFSYLAKVIRHNLYDEMGVYQDLQSTNPELIREHLNSNYQALMKVRHFEKILNARFPKAYKDLAKASQAKDLMQFGIAYNLLQDLTIPDKDISLYPHFLALDLAGRDLEHKPRVNPERALEAIKLILNARLNKPEIRSALEVCGRLYPLGVTIAQSKLKIHLYDVPTLKKGGLFIGEQNIAGIYRIIRLALEKDDLENSTEHFKVLLSRQNRYYAGKIFTKAGLAREEIVTQALVDKALA